MFSKLRRYDRPDAAAGALATGIWDTARSIRGTPAESYLVDACGVDVEQITDIDDVLRFEARCPFDGRVLPCLIGLVRDVLTDAPKAIIRTALDADGQKVEHRALGPTENGAVKLWSDAAVTQGLVVGEGLEATAAAATRIEHQGTLMQPAWAMIDRNNLRDFQVLPVIEALTVLVGQGADAQEAADACTRRWLAAGRYVHQIISHSVATGVATGITTSNNNACTGGAR